MNMTFRAIVNNKLGRMLGVLAHPHRSRSVEDPRPQPDVRARKTEG